MFNIKQDNSDLSDLENASVPIEIAIEMFEKHLSVLDIKQNISIEKKFNFSSTDICDIDKETTALNNKKFGTLSNISTKRLVISQQKRNA